MAEQLKVAIKSDTISGTDMAGKRTPQSYLFPHTHTSKTNVWKIFLKAYKQSTFLLKSPFSLQGQSVYFDILSLLLMRASHCTLIHLFSTPQKPDSMGWLKDSIKIHPNPQCITHTLLWKVKKNKQQKKNLFALPCWGHSFSTHFSKHCF